MNTKTDTEYAASATGATRDPLRASALGRRLLTLEREAIQREQRTWPRDPRAVAESVAVGRVVESCRSAAREDQDTAVDPSERLRAEIAELRENVKTALHHMSSEDPGRFWHGIGILRRICESGTGANNG